MLKGTQLVHKLVELDGQGPNVAMSECGYACEVETGQSFFLVDEFEMALSRYGEGYVSAIANLRKSFLKESPLVQVSSTLLLRRFTGSDLLKQIYSLDSDFRPGPPWDDKRKVVIKCGYVTLTDMAEINVNFNAFNTAFYEACGGNYQPLSGDLGCPNDNSLPARLIGLATCIANSSGINKSDLMAIRVTYEGMGDDGAIDTLQYLFAAPGWDQDNNGSESKSRMQPPPGIRFRGDELTRNQYEEMIKDDCFEIIGNAHGSCFNEEGSSGYLLIDIESSTIYGTHTQNAFTDGHYSQDEDNSQYCIR